MRPRSRCWTEWRAAIAIKQLESVEQADVGSMRAEYLRKLGSPPPINWRNLSDLDQIVTALLAAGRAESAALLLEQAHPAERAPWEVVDRIATLRLHLGEPARARELWRKAVTVPATGHPGRADRDDLSCRRRLRGRAPPLSASARSQAGSHSKRITASPSSSRTPVMPQSAYELARKAAGAAPDESARSTARAIAAGVARFARRTGTAATEVRRELPAADLAGPITLKRARLAPAWRGRFSSLCGETSALRR